MLPSPALCVIARYQNGLVVKGYTADFRPGRGRFHLLPADSWPGARPAEILIHDLKGVFFVRRLGGNPAHRKRNRFESTNITPGRRTRVVFNDGEILQGTTLSYRPGGTGFFLTPADPCSNNERCFVVAAATREVLLL